MSNLSDIEILKHKIVLDDKIKVEEGKIRIGNDTFTRLRVNRDNAVAVLVHNTDTNKIILTRQYRYAIAASVTEPILEIVAGKIEAEDLPEKTAVREVEEEIGYKLNEAHLKLLLSCFASPGYTSEQMFVYYAAVTNADKISDGGGLKEEHEYIERVEMPLEEFTSQVRDGLIKDAKTYIAGLYMILQWH